MQVFDWVNVFAMAVNEENAAGGRVGSSVAIPSSVEHGEHTGEFAGALLKNAAAR